MAFCGTSESSVVSRVWAISGSEDTGPPPPLERVYGLLGDAELVGKLDLSDALSLGLGRDALDQGDEEYALEVGDGHAIGCATSVRLR